MIKIFYAYPYLGKFFIYLRCFNLSSLLATLNLEWYWSDRKFEALRKDNKKPILKESIPIGEGIGQ